MFKHAFFGKTSCLKIQYNEGTTYLHMGRAKVVDKGLPMEKTIWEWDKLKMSDLELGEIVAVLDGKKPAWSTVHVFNENQNKIWINRANDCVFFKINDTNKAMSTGEQEVLKVLMQHAIWKMTEEAKE